MKQIKYCIYIIYKNTKQTWSNAEHVKNMDPFNYKKKTKS